MTTESSTSRKQTAKQQISDPPPARKAPNRRTKAGSAAVSAEPAQAAAPQHWPEPPRQALQPLAAEAPSRVRRAQPEAVVSGVVALEPDADTSALAQIPPLRSGKAVKPPKLKKPKPVRDSFTMPKAEYQLIELLKARATARQRPVKKSEILRAGIIALADMTDAQLFASLDAVPVIKTGRPRSE